MNRALRTFIWLMLLDLLVRSVDYATGGDVYVPDDNLAIPGIWGAVGLVTFTVLLAGLVTRRASVVKFGSITAFAVYLMISVQLFEAAMLPYPWPPENPRLSVSLLVFSLMWLAVAGIIWWREYLERECEKEELSG